MLTAIVRSRQAAHDRAWLMFVPDKLPLVAMSTLVVVPSACKMHEYGACRILLMCIVLMESWTEEIQKLTCPPPRWHHADRELDT